jgi:hypothetical protein
MGAVRADAQQRNRRLSGLGARYAANLATKEGAPTCRSRKRVVRPPSLPACGKTDARFTRVLIWHW